MWPDDVAEGSFSKLLLVDGNNIFMRGLKVLGVELSVGDIPTGPLLFFINSLARHIRNEEPDAVMVCWDGGRSVMRSALSPAYKAHRPVGENNTEHFKYALKFLHLAGIQQYQMPGWEGDDLIAGYIKLAPARQVVMVGDDNDLNQLVSDRVVQTKISVKSAADRFTPPAVLHKWGCVPEHVPYVKALMGDVGDGVVGLKGIGPKKAVKMLDSHRYDWAALLQSLTPEDRATVELAYRLVDLRHPLSDVMLSLPTVTAFAPTSPGTSRYADLHAFLQDFEMATVLSRLQEGSLWK